MTETEETRPRYGLIMRKDGGDREQVVFHPTMFKDTYRMLYAGTEEPAVLLEGDTFHIQGAILEEQRILYRMGGEEKSAMLSPRKKEAPSVPRKGITVADRKDRKETSVGKGLLYLAAFGAIVLGFIAGIKAIFWGF